MVERKDYHFYPPFCTARLVRVYEWCTYGATMDSIPPLYLVFFIFSSSEVTVFISKTFFWWSIVNQYFIKIWGWGFFFGHSLRLPVSVPQFSLQFFFLEELNYTPSFILLLLRMLSHLLIVWLCFYRSPKCSLFSNW